MPFLKLQFNYLYRIRFDSYFAQTGMHDKSGCTARPDNCVAVPFSNFLFCTQLVIFQITFINISRTPRFQQFIQQCLLKDYTSRPSTEGLLKHGFIREQQHEKQIRNQLRDHLDRHRKRKREFCHDHM